MAAEFNLGFHCYPTLGSVASVLDRQASSFPNALTTAPPISPFGGCFGVNSASLAEMTLPPSPNFGNTSSSSSSCSLLMDSASGLKHDTGFAVDWSPDEQYKLEEGLDKYGDEMHILKYIKIAVELPEKSVRDVALRCRWMRRKRRKGEEIISGKRLNHRKQMDSPQSELFSAIPLSDRFSSRPIFPLDDISGKSSTKHLLEKNSEAFSKITSNLSMFKVQDNVDLFLQTRSNINTILNQLCEMPGIMMPPLRVSVDDNLVTYLISTTVQSCMQIQSKQEPRC